MIGNIDFYMGGKTLQTNLKGKWKGERTYLIHIYIWQGRWSSYRMRRLKPRRKMIRTLTDMDKDGKRQ